MKANLVNENFSSDYVASLLKARGIESGEDYYHPTKKYLQDPTDLKNIRLTGENLHQIGSIR